MTSEAILTAQVSLIDETYKAIKTIGRPAKMENKDLLKDLLNESIVDDQYTRIERIRRKLDKLEDRLSIKEPLVSLYNDIIKEIEGAKNAWGNH